MNSEDGAEVVGGSGSRPADNREVKEVFPQSNSNFRSILFAGFVSLGGITALLAVGRASSTLDEAVADNKRQDAKIEMMMSHLHKNDIEQNKLLNSIEKNSLFMNKYFDHQKELGDNQEKDMKDTKQRIGLLERNVAVMQGTVISKVDNTRTMKLASR